MDSTFQTDSALPVLLGTVSCLLPWYSRVRRPLPWRETRDPYRIWLSEIMLQQTRISAVLDYYARFLYTLPTVSALAAVDDETLMKLWQGLGYYSRARNLKKAAQKVMSDHGGVFPQDYESIRSLPGIGDYTAGAIASIAFGIPVPAVDGNVLRVLTRVLSDPRDISDEKVKKSYREILLQVIPQDAPGEFNQALMELGQQVCLPNGAPFCEQCPLQALCSAHREHTEEAFPVKKKAKARRVEQRKVWVISYEGKFALRKRPSSGLLADLWEFPNTLCEEVDPLPLWNLAYSAEPELVGTGKHIFSHIEWQLQIFRVPVSSSALPEGWVWASPRELAEVYAVPTAFQSVYLPLLDSASI